MKIFRGILAVLAGFIAGSLVNFGILLLSAQLIPPPEGVDPSDLESIRENLTLYQPKHFVMPFLAHALGTLVGAVIASCIAISRRMVCGLAVGVLFLVGGVMAASMIPAPVWFLVLDLGVAYLPMAWLGGSIGRRLGKG